MQDLQQSKVYKWEQDHIAPHDKGVVTFPNIASIVNYIWENEKLKYPPLVSPIPSRLAAVADANRTELRFRKSTNTWIILHELAHAMTTLCNDRSNYHGALFLGVYCNLVSKYMKVNKETLVSSVIKSGLEIEPNTIPVFVD